MEVRSKLGASLGNWELLEGRLDAIVFGLISEFGQCPQELSPSSGGTAG